MSDRHPCAALGCVRVIPTAMLMCGPHWRMVPRILQRRVWACHLAGQAPGRDLAGQLSAAARAAIRAVAELEGRP